jgi:hypothetical protein
MCSPFGEAALTHRDSDLEEISKKTTSLVFSILICSYIKDAIELH